MTKLSLEFGVNILKVIVDFFKSMFNFANEGVKSLNQKKIESKSAISEDQYTEVHVEA